MEKQALLAIVLSILILVAWQMLFAPQKPVAPPSETMEEAGMPPDQEEQRFEAISPAEPLHPAEEIRAAEAEILDMDIAPTEDKDVVVETDLYTATFTTEGAALKSFELKAYTNPAQCKCSEAMNLVFDSSESPDQVGEDVEKWYMVKTSGGAGLPLSIEMASPSQRYIGALSYAADVDSIELLEPGAEPESITFRAATRSGIVVTKELTFHPGRYLIDLSVRLDNLTRVHEGAILALRWMGDQEGKKSRYDFEGFVAYINQKFTKESLDKIDERKVFSNRVQWAGMADKYFLAAILPDDPALASFQLDPPREKAVAGSVLYPTASYLTEDGSATFRYSVYIGPKEMARLKGVGSELEKAIDLGWFSVIAKPLIITLQFFYKYIGNYGIAIILLTVIIKILFYPLTRKSMSSMKQMSKIQPKIKELQAKYKDDKEKLNREMMALYRTHKVNPLGGCFPMLLQIPVFFALYRALLSSIELRQAPFLLWITDLSAKDPCYITPIIMGVSMVVQQKMTPTAGDPNQAKMMMMMPVVFTFMFLNFPSGLVVYWLANNLLSIGQQYFINKERSPEPQSAIGKKAPPKQQK